MSPSHDLLNPNFYYGEEEMLLVKERKRDDKGGKQCGDENGFGLRTPLTAYRLTQHTHSTQS